MKSLPTPLACALLLLACTQSTDQTTDPSPQDWSARAAAVPTADTLTAGKSYLSIYSEIYSSTEHKTHPLTAMVSLRNTSDADTVYVTRAEYYDTHGVSVREYFDAPIYLAPLETAEIIIAESDLTGGTGSNLIIEWRTPANAPEPLFEAVMNSTAGQQGLSFTTQAIRIE